MIPATIILLNGESLLLALRQDPEVARLAGQYLKVLVFGIPGYAGFEITRRWLQCQGLMIVPTLSLIVASPINILLNWLLVWGPDSVRIGFIGAPVSTAISFNVMVGLARCSRYSARDMLTIERIPVPLQLALLHLLRTARGMGRLHDADVQEPQAKYPSRSSRLRFRRF